MPLVSVIMAAYKEPISIFESAVDSILSQTVSDLELIVVLDCPSNGELRMAIEDAAGRDVRVVPLWNEENLGLAQSLNRAIQIARGQFVCRMDADDVALPHRIELQRKLIDDGCGLVGGVLEVIDQNENLLYVAEGLPLEAKQISKALRWNNCVPHPSWFGKKEVFESGYRDIPLCEDYDFLLRAALRGVKMGNVAEPVLRYRMGEESLSRSNLYRQYLYQRYLTKEYARGRSANIADATSWVETRYDERKSQRYLRANRLFNQGLSSLRQGQYGTALCSFLKVPVTSCAYMAKVIRLVLAALS